MNKKQAIQLLHRGYDLAQAEYHFSPAISHLGALFHKLGDSESAATVDRRILTDLETVLEREIRPQMQGVWEEFVGLFGFAWRDWVRVSNPRQRTVELEPTELLCTPNVNPPYGVLFFRALKRDGRPGKQIVETKLVVGVTKVAVLSPEPER